MNCTNSAYYLTLGQILRPSTSQITSCNLRDTFYYIKISIIEIHWRNKIRNFQHIWNCVVCRLEIFLHTLNHISDGNLQILLTIENCQQDVQITTRNMKPGSSGSLLCNMLNLRPSVSPWTLTVRIICRQNVYFRNFPSLHNKFRRII